MPLVNMVKLVHVHELMYVQLQVYFLRIELNFLFYEIEHFTVFLNET